MNLIRLSLRCVPFREVSLLELKRLYLPVRMDFIWRTARGI
jgi:hypothetical protein